MHNSLFKVKMHFHDNTTYFSSFVSVLPSFLL